MYFLKKGVEYSKKYRKYLLQNIPDFIRLRTIEKEELKKKKKKECQSNFNYSKLFSFCFYCLPSNDFSTPDF